jgi:transposase InsO family protein
MNNWKHQISHWLMRKAYVECKQRRRYRVTTDSNHKLALADNMLNRQLPQLLLIKHGQQILRICGHPKDGYMWQQYWIYSHAVL